MERIFPEPTAQGRLQPRISSCLLGSSTSSSRVHSDHSTWQTSTFRKGSAFPSSAKTQRRPTPRRSQRRRLGLRCSSRRHDAETSGSSPKDGLGMAGKSGARTTSRPQFQGYSARIPYNAKNTKIQHACVVRKRPRVVGQLFAWERQLLPVKQTLERRASEQASVGQFIFLLTRSVKSLVVYRISTRACHRSGRARAGFDSPPGSMFESFFIYSFSNGFL